MSLKEELQKAKINLNAAEQNCPHWDNMGDNDNLYNCCYDVIEAELEFQNIKEKML